ncbi:sulfatase [Saccharicrinis sp. GN24d3]|uniref:sulfatase n=1 Tax=Saccharicrinis sp. GN24d3 TaxID=3458416 RepID=UPI0040362BD4
MICKCRKNRVRFILGIAIILIFFASGCSRQPAEQPNVLFISLDDLNDWIEPLGGHPQAITPNLQRLSDKSVLFTNAYCASPACNPSRTSIMSGLAPHTSGVYSNYQDWREVITDYTSMGKYFRNNGYYSAGAGKIYHYHMVDTTCWDEYWPSQKKNMPDEYIPEKAESGTINMPAFENMYKMFDWAALDIEDSLMADYKSVTWVSDQLRKNHEKPFFLACGIYRPHVPWYVPKKYFDMFPLDSIQLPKTMENDLDDVSDRAMDIAHRGGNYHKHILEAGLWKQAVQGYLASIAFCDAMLGRLLTQLENSKYAENTIVVLWSDHGWQLGEKEHWRKFALWRNTARSVLMIKAPQGCPGLPEGSENGTKCHRTVSLLDIYPTLGTLCGLPARHDLDGHSLIPLLKNPKSEWEYPAITSYNFSEFAISTQNWRYIQYIDGSEELYNQMEDEEEWFNLAKNPAYHHIKEELKQHIPSNPAPLKITSLKLMPHHYPPFKSREEYQDWLKHGKDTKYLIENYWN